MSSKAQIVGGILVLLLLLAALWLWRGNSLPAPQPQLYQPPRAAALVSSPAVKAQTLSSSRVSSSIASSSASGNAGQADNSLSGAQLLDDYVERQRLPASDLQVTSDANGNTVLDLRGQYQHVIGAEIDADGKIIYHERQILPLPAATQSGR